MLLLSIFKNNFSKKFFVIYKNPPCQGFWDFSIVQKMTHTPDFFSDFWGLRLSNWDNFWIYTGRLLCPYEAPVRRFTGL
jgi:hypothetical protein